MSAVHIHEPIYAITHGLNPKYLHNIMIEVDAKVRTIMPACPAPLSLLGREAPRRLVPIQNMCHVATPPHSRPEHVPRGHAASFPSRTCAMWPRRSQDVWTGGEHSLTGTILVHLHKCEVSSASRGEVIAKMVSWGVVDSGSVPSASPRAPKGQD